MRRALKYFFLFPKRSVIGCWSSGTGGAGIFGSFSYAALITLGLTPCNSMMIMEIIPILEGATFWLLLRKPNKEQNPKPKCQQSSNDEERPNENDEIELSLSQKIRYIPSLFKYMIPLLCVFFCEYFINQGLVCI